MKIWFECDGCGKLVAGKLKSLQTDLTEMVAIEGTDFTVCGDCYSDYVQDQNFKFGERL